MAKQRKSITASELLENLANDPLFQQQEHIRQLAHEDLERRCQEDERSIVADLASVGIIVSSVSDLLVRREPYPEAIPVLLQHLQQPHMDNVRDMLARSLATPQASYAHHLLVMEYRKQVAIDKFSGKISYVADGLAVAIAVTVQEEDMQSLLELAKEESLGDSRVLFLLRLKKSKNKVIVDALRERAFDPTFSKEIASWKTSSRNCSVLRFQRLAIFPLENIRT